MEQIPDAPWIRETEATGYCRWWNDPPEEEEQEQLFAVYDPE